MPSRSIFATQWQRYEKSSAEQKAGDGEHGGHARTDGGTRCDDVVDDKNVAMGEVDLAGQAEGAFHVIHALGYALLSLTAVEGGTLHGIRHDGQVSGLAHAACNLHTLVIATLALVFTLERHGYDEVDAVEEVEVCHLLGCHATEHRSHFGMVVVFQVVDDVAHLRPRLIEKQC